VRLWFLLISAVIALGLLLPKGGAPPSHNSNLHLSRGKFLRKRYER